MSAGSQIRRAQQERYRADRPVFLQFNTICFRCRKFIPPERRTLHHFFGRVRQLLCFWPGYRMACDKCHEWIESHRKQAILLGLRADERLWNRPSLVIPKEQQT